MVKRKETGRGNIGVIYKIHCIPENKDYIGQTGHSLFVRWKSHCREAQNRKTNNAYKLTLIDQKIFEYGEDAFTREVLEKVPLDKLNERERHWISVLDTQVPNGYNQSPGGGHGRHILLSPEEERDIIASYMNGEGAETIATRYDCGSQFILNFLRGCDIQIRSHDESNELKRKNTYYRIHPDTNEILEEYKSFAQIGQWAQENKLTTIANASTAGMATRYAILFGTEMYGYKWDSNWSEAEKEERRRKFKKSSAKSHSKPSNAEKKNIPDRETLKYQLQTMSRREVKDLYEISDGCLDNWRHYYRLGASGQDLEGWENAPQQYDRSEKQTPQKTPSPSYDELSQSLTAPSIEKAASSFNVGIFVYQRWLREAGLPSSRKEIDIYLLEHGLDKQPRSTSKTRQTNKQKQKQKQKQSLSKRSPVKQRPSKIPERNVLQKEIRHMTFVEIGQMHGVSDTAVRKWCDKLELPNSTSIIKRIPDNEWDYACTHWKEVRDDYGESNYSHGSLKTSEQDAALLLFEKHCSIKAIAHELERDEQTIRKFLRSRNIDTNVVHGRRVQCTELGIEAESLSMMARKLLELKIPSNENPETVRQQLRRALKHQNAVLYGLHFKYLEL